MDISQREQVVLYLFLRNESLSSSTVHAMLVREREKASPVTVKRTLSDMADRGLLTVSGAGRTTAYQISLVGRLFVDIDAQAYCAIDPDKRFGLRRYDFNLFTGIPEEIFSASERRMLDEATQEYVRRTTDIPPAIAKKELERLIIELSWKSSKIEGNTYTLLDTEKLILENKEAVGHDRKESRMILNHKEAFLFVREHAASFRTPTLPLIEELHAILVKDLNVGTGIRTRPVGVTGSVYQPLDNVQQLREGMTALLDAVSRVATPYAKALIALLGLSYLQPFEDGNKRTARLLGNAVLLAHGCAPLSYRSVEENAYREATLVFYETNSLVPFKDIFIGQYDFAARNYAVR